jgi:H2-forming N5,N10-methylenetetrahydromethanopterin dehydrogenase-like enzyme
MQIQSMLQNATLGLALLSLAGCLAPADNPSLEVQYTYCQSYHHGYHRYYHHHQHFNQAYTCVTAISEAAVLSNSDMNTALETRRVEVQFSDSDAWSSLQGTTQQRSYTFETHGDTPVSTALATQSQTPIEVESSLGDDEWHAIMPNTKALTALLQDCDSDACVNSYTDTYVFEDGQRLEWQYQRTTNQWTRTVQHGEVTTTDIIDPPTLIHPVVSAD